MNTSKIIVFLFMLVLVSCNGGEGGPKWEYTNAGQLWSKDKGRTELDLRDMDAGEISLRFQSGTDIAECAYLVKSKTGDNSFGVLDLEIKEGYLFLCDKYARRVNYQATTSEGVDSLIFDDIKFRQ